MICPESTDPCRAAVEMHERLQWLGSQGALLFFGQDKRDNWQRGAVEASGAAVLYLGYPDLGADGLHTNINRVEDLLLAWVKRPVIPKLPILPIRRVLAACEPAHVAEGDKLILVSADGTSYTTLPLQKEADEVIKGYSVSSVALDSIQAA